MRQKGPKTLDAKWRMLQRTGPRLCGETCPVLERKSWNFGNNSRPRRDFYLRWSKNVLCPDKNLRAGALKRITGDRPRRAISVSVLRCC